MENTNDLRVGDTITIRDFEELKKGYPIEQDSSGNSVIMGCFNVYEDTSKSKGQVTHINLRGGWIKAKFPNSKTHYGVPIQAIAHNFSYREEIEVSHDGFNTKAKRLFVGYLEGNDAPFVCVSYGWEEEFNKGLPIALQTWKYARKIRKPDIQVTIKRDGVEVTTADLSNEDREQVKNIMGF